MWLLCGCASATDYYVATTGDNANSGTQESPFLTISYAIDYAHDGDTIYVNSGTYTEQIYFSSLIEPRLHLVGIGDTKPIVTYSGGTATIVIGTNGYNTPNATGHTIQNLDVRNTFDSAFASAEGIICSYNANTANILIDNCNITTISRGFHVSHGLHTNITIQNCIIHTQKGGGVICEPTIEGSSVNVINNNIWAAESGYYSGESSGIYIATPECYANVSENKVWFSGYTGIKPNSHPGIYLNNTIYESGYAHNAFEANVRGAILRGNRVLGHNSSQQNGGSRAGNVFYGANPTHHYNMSCYDFYSNNTTWGLVSVGGHQHDYYIENFTADNHRGNGFTVAGYSDPTYPAFFFTSNNIVLKNCSINTSFTSSSSSPMRITSLGTNTTENPIPYTLQDLTGFTRDNVSFINQKIGGNYYTGYHDWYISDRVAGDANKHHHGNIKIINANHVDDIYFEIDNPINCSTTAEVMYYADVVLQYTNNTKISNAPITFSTTATNPETLSTIFPVNINASSGEKAYVDEITSTTTGASGRTPLPSDIANTIAITDFIKSKSGTTDINWTINADGVILDGVNPDQKWYRNNQDVSKYTITAINNSSENTHITGYAPSVEENTFSDGDSVTYQVWTSEPVDSVSWKKNGVEVATSGLTYTDTFSTDPVVMSFSATDANGDVSYTWDYNPEALPVAEFTANVTSGTVPLTVQFTDLSENALSWYWDFDNDGTADSTTQNPEYIYSTAGTYTVNLTVQNGENADSEVKELYISVESPSIINSYWNSFWAWWGMRWQVTYWLQEAV